MLRHGWGDLRGVAGGTGRVSSSCGQGADLDEVVGEYSVSAPGSDSRQGGQLGAVPSVASFEVVDTTFTSGPPFDLGAEGFSVLEFAVPNAIPGSVFTADSQHQESPSSPES